MWLYRGAREVVAVEPVPEHFRYLQKNVVGLPVTCLQASLGIQTPKIPDLTFSMSYGIKEVQELSDFLPIPTINLIDLVNEYKPTVVKLNCEGCEHYVLDEVILLPNYGIKHISVSFHNMLNRTAYDSLKFVEQHLGKGIKIIDKPKQSRHGIEGRTVTVYWSLQSKI